jgi:hypothetical protein
MDWVLMYTQSAYVSYAYSYTSYKIYKKVQGVK